MRAAVRPRLPDFSVVVWLQKTNKFATLKAELLGAAVTEPYESTEYQGMVDFHWSAANLAEAKRLAEALKGVAQRSPVKDLTAFPASFAEKGSGWARWKR
jgi:hypothetical protein